jgi:hypothetical protein
MLERCLAAGDTVRSYACRADRLCKGVRGIPCTTRALLSRITLLPTAKRAFTGPILRLKLLLGVITPLFQAQALVSGVSGWPSA